MMADAAIFEALSLYKQPARARSINRQGLPPDMLNLIKIAAGDDQTMVAWAQASGENPEILRQAAVFYLQQTIARAGQDPYRTLGLAPRASSEDIRNHKRWLLKWLHPDRNPSKWETALFHRVNAVAQLLEAGAGETGQKLASPAVGSRGFHRHRRRQRTDSKSHLPQRHPLWKNILRRVGRRAAAVTAALTIAWLAVHIFTGGELAWPASSIF